MADIFISYARADREKIEKLAAALEGEGYSVWWDRYIAGGAEFSAEIERELDAAKVVIVCWSAAGSKSRWVRDEASIAAEAGKLIAVMLDRDLPPIGFRQYHALDLSAGKGAQESAAFQDLARTVAVRLEGDAAGPVAPVTGAAPAYGAGLRNWRPSSAVLISLIVVAAIVLIVIFDNEGPAPPSVEMQSAADDAAPANSEPSAPPQAREKSIAVLPFADFSPQGDQEWFGDGLAEEILNTLARTPDLLVASRTSSFKYKDADEEIPVIAERLGVEHVLEGSVRRSSDRLRVTAQLIRAEDGFHLWSETYDRSADDVIAIQEDIALEIAQALETAMDPQALAEMVSAGTRSVEAYRAYLEGLAHFAQAFASAEKELFVEGYNAFERARAIDAGFADAHYRAGEFWKESLLITHEMPALLVAPEKALQNALERIDFAIETQPNEARQEFYKAGRAFALARFRDAARHLENYLETFPNDLDARNELTIVYQFLAEYEKARALVRETEAISGDDADQLSELITGYIWSRDYDSAARVSRRAAALAPDNADVLYQAQRALLWAGDVEAARAAAAGFRSAAPQGASRLTIDIRDACAAADRTAAERAAELLFASGSPDKSLSWIALQMLRRVDEADRLIADLDRSAPPYQIVGFLYYPYFNASAFPNISRVLEREDVNRPAPVEIPFACPPTADPLIGADTE